MIGFCDELPELSIKKLISKKGDLTDPSKVSPQTKKRSSPGIKSYVWGLIKIF